MELALIIVGVIAVIALHYWLTRQRVAWLGAIVPIIWVAGLVALFVRGEIDRPVDYVMCVIGTVFLLRIYTEGRAKTGKKARVA